MIITLASHLKGPLSSPLGLHHMSAQVDWTDVGVNMSVNNCLSTCVGPVMDWRPAQGEPHLLLNDTWDQLPPLQGQVRITDGWMKTLVKVVAAFIRVCAAPNHQI